MSAGTYEIEVHASAAPTTVWNLVGDATTWSRWAAMARSDYEVEGDPAPHGVGAVRVLGTGPFLSRERVVVHDPPHHLGYELLSGLPVRGYRADVHLSDDGAGGTNIVWKGTWASTAPLAGPAMAWFLPWVVRRIARSLASAAEQP